MSESKESKKAPKFLKAGKVVLLLTGRMVGKKAVIVKTFDEGTSDRPYGHCLVAGIAKYPLKITKTMSEKKIAKRSKVRLRLPQQLCLLHPLATRTVWVGICALDVWGVVAGPVGTDHLGARRGTGGSRVVADSAGSPHARRHLVL